MLDKISVNSSLSSISSSNSRNICCLASINASCFIINLFSALKKDGKDHDDDDGDHNDDGDDDGDGDYVDDDDNDGDDDDGDDDDMMIMMLMIVMLMTMVMMMVMMMLMVMTIVMIIHYTLPFRTRQKDFFNEVNIIQLNCNLHGFRILIKFPVDS